MTFIPGTVKPEADYEEFARLGAKLGLPCPQAHITVESFGPDGALVDRYHDRSRTLNRNYWNWLFGWAGALFSTNGTTAPTTTGAEWSGTFGAGVLNLKSTAAGTSDITDVRMVAQVAAVTSVVRGIVVGTGSTAESFDGHVLATPCANGTGVNQFAYAAGAAPTVTYNAGTKVWTAVHTRILNNNSAGTIVVAETAMYVSSDGATSHMIMRDVLGATISVLAGGQATATYTFTLTFPA